MGGGGKGSAPAPVDNSAQYAMALEEQKTSNAALLASMEESNAAFMAKSAADLAAAQKSAADTAAATALKQGLATRDDVYSKYMTAASSSVDFVNSKINDEKSNAALMGVDYKMNDQIKQSRINDYFASIWGEGDQQTLDSYMTKYGKPEGFTGYTVTRGDGSTIPSTLGSEKRVAVSQGTAATKNVLGL